MDPNDDDRRPQQKKDEVDGPHQEMKLERKSLSTAAVSAARTSKSSSSPSEWIVLVGIFCAILLLILPRFCLLMYYSRQYWNVPSTTSVTSTISVKRSIPHAFQILGIDMDDTIDIPINHPSNFDGVSSHTSSESSSSSSSSSVSSSTEYVGTKMDRHNTIGIQACISMFEHPPSSCSVSSSCSSSSSSSCASSSPVLSSTDMEEDTNNSNDSGTDMSLFKIHMYCRRHIKNAYRTMYYRCQDQDNQHRPSVDPCPMGNDLETVIETFEFLTDQEGWDNNGWQPLVPRTTTMTTTPNHRLWGSFIGGDDETFGRRTVLLLVALLTAMAIVIPTARRILYHTTINHRPPDVGDNSKEDLNDNKDNNKKQKWYHVYIKSPPTKVVGFIFLLWYELLRSIFVSVNDDNDNNGEDTNKANSKDDHVDDDTNDEREDRRNKQDHDWVILSQPSPILKKLTG